MLFLHRAPSQRASIRASGGVSSGMNAALTSIAAAAPAIAMLGMFACLIGGSVLIVKNRDRKKGMLMLVMAAVLLANVAIWTL